MNLFQRKPKPPVTRPAPLDEQHLVPQDPATHAPMPQREQPGYYPGFSTMSQQKFWEPATRNLILQRVYDPAPIRFFSAEQAKFWRLVHEHLIPQHDRTPDKRVDTLVALDTRLFEDRTDGYRYDTMPQDRVVYTSAGIDAIAAESHAQFGGDLLFLPFRQADLVLQAIHDGKPQSHRDPVWKRLDIQRFWQLILTDAIEGYYAHPFAWDEVGFGGPAYPRAYTRLERGEPEPWEVEETRYAWAPPAAAVSGEITQSDNEDQQSHQGSGGTH